MTTTDPAPLVGIDDIDLPMSVRTVDPETGGPGPYVAFNRAFFQTYRIDAPPEGPGDIVGGDSHADIDSADQRVIDTAEAVELHVTRHDSSIALRKMPIVRDGQVTAILTLSTDVTAIAAASTERDLLTVAAHATDDRLFLYRTGGPDGPELAFANRAGAAFDAALVGDDALASRARDQLTGSLAAVAESGTRRELQVELNDELSLVRDEPLTDDDGNVLAVVRTISDLTPLIEADWTEQLLTIAGLDDTDAAIEATFATGSQLLDLPIGVLAELDDDELVVHAQRGGETLPGRLPAHPDFIGALERGRVRLFRDLVIVDAAGPIVQRLGLRSLATIPIEVEGRKWGLLAFGDVEPRAERFPERTIPLLTALGGTLATLLERDAAQARLVPLELLERSNRELEEYAYAAAHDLRSPLRAMHSFAQLLRRQLDTDPTDEAKLRSHADRIVEGASRMGELLTSMLEHARVASGDDQDRAIPVGAVVDIIRGTLADHIERHDALVTVGPLPTVTVEQVQLERIFHNLIDNAINYRHPDRRPTIRIDASIDAGAGEVLLHVRDNGVGIAPEQRESAFKLFKRLSTDGDGTGVGLALVRRIAEEHGGSVTIDDGEPTDGDAVDGEPVGSVFTVRLPDRYLAADSPALPEAAIA